MSKREEIELKINKRLIVVQRFKRTNTILSINVFKAKKAFSDESCKKVTRGCPGGNDLELVDVLISTPTRTKLWNQ